MPPSEMALHPLDAGGKDESDMMRTELYFMCEDLDKTIATLSAKGIECAEEVKEIGGAVATHLRGGSPMFSQVLFPVYFGIMVWGGLYLRDPRVSALIPFRGTDA